MYKMDWLNLLNTISKAPIPILDDTISLKKYHPIDLSITNTVLHEIDITDPFECQKYIEKVLDKGNAEVAYGGYLEKRNLYLSSERFSGNEARNIHLGMDFWCSADTKVMTPMRGTVHSFKNNRDMGNYGPTIILQHAVQNTVFYTLYGHLSEQSLENLYIGKMFDQGEKLATLGDTPINVNYAPHLHFQLIYDIQGFNGDYPGVCSSWQPVR